MILGSGSSRQYASDEIGGIESADCRRLGRAAMDSVTGKQQYACRSEVKSIALGRIYLLHFVNIHFIIDANELRHRFF